MENVRVCTKMGLEFREDFLRGRKGRGWSRQAFRLNFEIGPPRGMSLAYFLKDEVKFSFHFSAEWSPLWDVCVCVCGGGGGGD